MGITLPSHEGHHRRGDNIVKGRARVKQHYLLWQDCHAHEYMASVAHDLCKIQPVTTLAWTGSATQTPSPGRGATEG